jgi:ribosomal protein S18 acetylase RimI-like enzyme
MRNAFVLDKFRPLHLRYLEYNPKDNSLQLLLDKGNNKDLSTGFLEDSTQTLLKYFLIGVTLPNDSFWVNLRPDQPDMIIDNKLVQTDVGKILLASDLQLKKDTAQYTSPATPEGRVYWDSLYRKAEEIYGSNNVSIPTVTRPWIVPDEIIVRQSAGSAYVYKATLKVMLEQDYIKDSPLYNFADPKTKELNDYAASLMRELIIPKITREINTSKRYASLRQVYYSLILAQWFKGNFARQSGGYAQLIDKKDLTGLTSAVNWSENTYYNDYRKSFAQGEYRLEEARDSIYGRTVRTYVSGGVLLNKNIQDAINNGAVRAVSSNLPAPVRNEAVGARVVNGKVQISNVPAADESILDVPPPPTYFVSTETPSMPAGSSKAPVDTEFVELKKNLAALNDPALPREQRFGYRTFARALRTDYAHGKTAGEKARAAIRRELSGNMGDWWGSLYLEGHDTQYSGRGYAVPLEVGPILIAGQDKYPSSAKDIKAVILTPECAQYKDQLKQEFPHVEFITIDEISRLPSIVGDVAGVQSSILAAQAETKVPSVVAPATQANEFVTHNLRLLLERNGITNIDPAELQKLAQRVSEAIKKGDGMTLIQKKNLDLTGINISGLDKISDNFDFGIIMGGMPVAPTDRAATLNGINLSQPGQLTSQQQRALISSINDSQLRPRAVAILTALRKNNDIAQIAELRDLADWAERNGVEAEDIAIDLESAVPLDNDQAQADRQLQRQKHQGLTNDYSMEGGKVNFGERMRTIFSRPVDVAVSFTMRKRKLPITEDTARVIEVHRGQGQYGEDVNSLRDLGIPTGAAVVIAYPSRQNNPTRESSDYSTRKRSSDTVVESAVGDVSQKTAQELFPKGLPAHIILTGAFFPGCINTVFHYLKEYQLKKGAASVSMHLVGDKIEGLEGDESRNFRKISSVREGADLLDEDMYSSSVSVFVDGKLKGSSDILKATNRTHFNIYYWSSTEALRAWAAEHGTARPAIQETASAVLPAGLLSRARVASWFAGILLLVLTPFSAAGLSERSTNANDKAQDTYAAESVTGQPGTYAAKGADHAFEGAPGSVSTGDMDLLAQPADDVIELFNLRQLNLGVQVVGNKLNVTPGIVAINGKAIRIVINNSQDQYAVVNPQGEEVSLNLDRINALLQDKTLTAQEKQAALERILIHEIAEAYALQLGRNEADAHQAGMFAEAMHPGQNQNIRNAIQPILLARDQRQAQELRDGRGIDGATQSRERILSTVGIPSRAIFNLTPYQNLRGTDLQQRLTQDLAMRGENSLAISGLEDVVRDGSDYSPLRNILDPIYEHMLSSLNNQNINDPHWRDALEEAISNAIIWGNRAQEGSLVILRWGYENGKFWVEVVDEGPTSYDPDTIQKPPTGINSMYYGAGSGRYVFERYLAPEHVRIVRDKPVFGKPVAENLNKGKVLRFEFFTAPEQEQTKQSIVVVPQVLNERANLIERDLRARTGQDIVLVDMATLRMDNQAIVEAVRNGQAIRLDYSGLGSDYEQISNANSALSAILNRASRGSFHQDQVRRVAEDMLDNAFVHGNGVNSALPVFVILDVQEGALEVYDMHDDLPETFMEREKAKKASERILHVYGMGVASINRNLPKGETLVIAPAGTTGGYVARAQLRPRASVQIVSDTSGMSDEQAQQLAVDISQVVGRAYNTELFRLNIEYEAQIKASPFYKAIKESRVIVARNASGQIVGVLIFGAVAPIAGLTTQYRISQLAVDPSVQQSGIGSRLMDAVVDIFRKRGVTKFSLGIALVTRIPNPQRVLSADEIKIRLINEMPLSFYRKYCKKASLTFNANWISFEKPFVDPQDNSKVILRASVDGEITLPEPPPIRRSLASRLTTWIALLGLGSLLTNVASAATQIADKIPVEPNFWQQLMSDPLTFVIGAAIVGVIFLAAMVGGANAPNLSLGRQVAEERFVLPPYRSGSSRMTAPGQMLDLFSRIKNRVLFFCEQNNIIPMDNSNLDDLIGNAIDAVLKRLDQEYSNLDEEGQFFFDGRGEVTVRVFRDDTTGRVSLVIANDGIPVPQFRMEGWVSGNFDSDTRSVNPENAPLYFGGKGVGMYGILNDLARRGNEVFIVTRDARENSGRMFRQDSAGRKQFFINIPKESSGTDFIITTPGQAPVTTTEEASTANPNPQPQEAPQAPGGIDFRGLPIIAQNISPIAAQGVLAAVNTKNINTDSSLGQMRSMLNAGIIPSCERLKEFLIASCAKDDCKDNLDGALSCIADILKMEEDRVQPTDPALREFLVLLESGRSASQMQIALAKVRVSPKEPQPIAQ